MKDRVPLYPGRVTLTPVSGQANTFDLVRADQPTQEGTPLNKASLLKDATAALFGLDATAVPDDALALISRFHKGLGNEYVWDKSIETYAPKYTEYTYTTKNVFLQLTNDNGTVTVHYGDAYTVNIDGTVSIPNESTFTCDYNSPESKFNVLKGKWWWSTNEGAKAVNFLPDGTTISRERYSNYYNYYSSLGNTIRNNFIPYYETEHIEYVNSPDPSAYPPTVSDGYTYTALGQLGNKVQIATGNYTGTGVYGPDNPSNSISFEFEPQMVFIAKGGGSAQWMCLIKPEGVGHFHTGAIIEVTFEGNTVSWTNSTGSGGAGYQLNDSEVKYYYIAIG